LIAISDHLVQDAMRMTAFRFFYLALGWLSVGLGIIGIILPILPTTPFLLVAVWAFSKSSPELAEKLRNHPKAGPYIRAWQDHGVIPKTGKILATSMMSVMMVYLAAFSALPLWAVFVAAVVFVSVEAFILTRPSEPPQL
jgi:uncharacterized protein